MGDYSLETWGSGADKVTLKKPSSHIANWKNSGLEPGFIGFSEKFLNDGYDYIYIPGKVTPPPSYHTNPNTGKRDVFPGKPYNVTSDGEPVWVMVSKKDRKAW